MKPALLRARNIKEMIEIAETGKYVITVEPPRFL